MTTKEIKLLRYLEAISQKRPFLGLYDSNKRFIPGFAKNSAPLKKKLKKGEPSHVIIEDQWRRVENAPKNPLVSLLIQALLRSNVQFTIDTDVSRAQIGCVRLQDQDSSELKAVCYW